MARAVEFLMPPGFQRRGGPMLEALMRAARQAGDSVVKTIRYQGSAEWLVLYGYGAPEQASARAIHREKGGHAVLWDIGYFGRFYGPEYMRVSINHEHPQRLLDAAPADGARWDSRGLKLREDRNPEGPIILVGSGPKSRRYLLRCLGVKDWERAKLKELRARFPGRKVIYRPKPRQQFESLDCATDALTPIDDLLRGASLVVCRHSNVACDAVLAGVPFECEDGAACWLAERPYTREIRLEFLQRLAWFQWHPSEARKAWRFLSGVIMEGVAH